MPLNALQQDTLFRAIDVYLNKIFDPSVLRPKKIEWLKRCISDTQATIEQVTQLLKEYPDLIGELMNAANLPKGTRGDWGSLLIYIGSLQPIPSDLLQKLSKFNNYNPFLIVDMKLFAKQITETPELAIIKDNFIALREAFLEMTPMCHDEENHSIRIGQCPFNLDQKGPAPLKGEIQAEIKWLIKDRLEQEDKHQKQIDAQERVKKEIEVMHVRTQKKLDEIAEQQQETLFTQAILTKYKAFESSTSIATPIQVSDIFSEYESFAPPPKQRFSAKSERLFNLQHVVLNNKITDSIRQVSTMMANIDMELKESKEFLDLRVTEFCSILVNIQLHVVDEKCTKEADFIATDINKYYKTQLMAHYKLNLEQMVGDWVKECEELLSSSNSKSLTKAESTNLSKKFKENIKNAMQVEFRKLQAFQVHSFSEMSDLRMKAQAQKEAWDAKIKECQERWDKAVRPLADLALSCNELRKLRSQVQNNECNLEIFNHIMSALFKMMQSAKFQETQEEFNFFHYACWGANLTLFQELMQKAQVGLLDSEGNSVIHLAVENESKITIELLEALTKQPTFARLDSVLDLKNKRSKTPLHIAAACDNLIAVQWILSKCKTQEARQKCLSLEDNGKMTALHYAAREGQEKTVHYLLTVGAGRLFNTEDTKNHPLILAIQRGHIGVTCLFFNEGIWLNAKQKEYIFKMAKQDPVVAYCLTIPVIEGLNNLMKIKSPLRVAESYPIKSIDKNHPLILAIQRGAVEIACLFFKDGIWLSPPQRDYILQIMEHSDQHVSIEYCLAIPIMEGLRDLSTLKPVLKNVKEHSLRPTVNVSTMVQQLNVSGQGNNCGLFALVLGLKKELDNKPQLKNKTRLPDYFETIDIKCLQGGTEAKETAELGMKLRQEMAHALLEDEQYKVRRYHSIVAVCRAFLENKSLPQDMQAWLKITHDYRESLKTQWIEFSTVLEKNYPKIEADYCMLLDAQPLKLEDIEHLKEALVKHLKDKHESSDLKILLEHDDLSKTNSVLGLIQLRRLYRAAWLNLTISTGLECNLLSDAIENIFKQKTQKILALLQKQGAAIEENLLLLSLLETTNFDIHGALCNNRLSSREEVLSTAAILFIENDLISHWEKIYQDYCEHIKTSTEMLSADELGSLARCWHIQLKVQFAYGQPYTTAHMQDSEPLQVTLSNPSRMHWNVVCDTTMQFEMKWDSAKIAALILAIENSEYKASIISAIYNEGSYARRLEDCSYIVGLLSAIQEMPQVLTQQNISLSAADLNAAKVLSQYFEEGLFRLNAELVYGLKSSLSILESRTTAMVIETVPAAKQHTLAFEYGNTRQRASGVLPNSTRSASITGIP